MNISRRDLEIQFERVVKKDWLNWFMENARRAGTTTAHLLALGSRETNLLNIRGDFRGGIYHGFGVLQVDIETDPAYCRHWTQDFVEPSIRRGTDIYLSKFRDTMNSVGKKTTCRARTFTGKEVKADDLRRIATAAYNCGRWAHYHFSLGNNIDSTTTGHDYSRDVYDRAIEFAEILENRKIESRAVQVELALQGKYARDAHKKRFTFSGPSRIKFLHAEAEESQSELIRADYERAPVTEEILSPVNTPTTTPSQETEQTKPSENQPAPPSSEQPFSSEPVGDAPDAPARGWLVVEDLKPFCLKWLKRIWGWFAALNTVQLPAFGTIGASVAATLGEYWWIAAGAAVVVIFGIFILLFVAALIFTIGFGVVWYVNRKEIFRGHQFVSETRRDPRLHNIDLCIERKDRFAPSKPRLEIAPLIA